MTAVDMDDNEAMWAAIDSGDEIAFGPAGEVDAGRTRFTMQRVAGGYRVKSGDGLRDVTVPTREQAEVEALRIAEASA